MTELVTGAQAVLDAISRVMTVNERTLTFGLGVNDPGRVFGTTDGLVEEFGSHRVFETPTSELAMTGVGVGLSIAGYPVIHSHQRMDFALLAMDQIVNSAAKWKYMFGDQFSVPYLTRMIIGRGWGQGPTHSQNLESWLVHVPGIRVLVPATPQDLHDSILALDGTLDPIVVIEHRWIHGITGEVSNKSRSDGSPLPSIIHQSERVPRVTIVTWGLATFDCLAAKAELSSQGVEVDVVQIIELSLDTLEKATESVAVTGHLLVVSNSWSPASFSQSVISFIIQESQKAGEKIRVASLGYPHAPEPTSVQQLEGFHISDWRVMNSVMELLQQSFRVPAKPPIDQPSGYDFGPF